MKRELNWIPAKLGTMPAIIWVTDGVYIRLMKRKFKLGGTVIYREENNPQAPRFRAYFQGFIPGSKKNIILSK